MLNEFSDREDGGLDAPFDIARVPAWLETDDSQLQSQAYLAALAGATFDPAEALSQYRACGPQPITLTTLQNLCQKKDGPAALEMLRGRRRIVVDDRHITDFDPEEMHWEIEGNYLDLLVCVGDGIGLGPLLPTLDAHHGFSFRLDVSKTHRPFEAKHVKLGFERQGCMMCIGRTGSGEDAWLAWAPRGDGGGNDIDDNSDDEGDEIDSNPGPRRNNSVMSVKRQRQAVMFLAYCLQEMGHRGVVVYETYPNVENFSHYEDASSIFDMVLDLNLESLRKLDEAIITHWHDWLRFAPDQYNGDRFFTRRVPICVTSRFGQNTRLMPHRVGQQTETWNRDRDWSRIRYVNIAVATHIRVQKSLIWFPLTVEQLSREYPDGIYDSPNPLTRQRLDDNQLQELLHENPGVNHGSVCNNLGYHVYTHDAGIQEDRHPYGILINSNHLNDLFATLPLDDVDESRMDDILSGNESIDSPPERAIPFTFYPQAGLRTFGHFQADGIPMPCYPIIGRLNKSLRERNKQFMVDDEQMFNDESEHFTGNHTRVVIPMASQGYNALMHQTRGRGSHYHDAQLGLVTAALAGQWTKEGSTAGRHASEFLRRCQRRMPHDTFNRKIDKQDIDRNLRMESVYCIDMEALHPHFRTGDVIINNIIHPLQNIWDHASTRRALQNQVQLFHPSSYPALYSWTTFPLTCLLDYVFDKGSRLYSVSKIKHTMMVEMAAVAERSLNYMHTGNAAVISTRVMTPLWIGRALIEDGFPCLNPNIVNILNGYTIRFSPEQWPLGDRLRRPISCSKASQLFRYGAPHFNMFYAHFAMYIVMSLPPPPFIEESDAPRRRALCLLAYCVSLFLEDCKEFVTMKVRQETKIQSRLPDPSPHLAQSRLAALAEWKSYDYTLSWSDNNTSPGCVYAKLVICLMTNPDDEDNLGLNEVEETLGYVALAKRLTNTVSNGGNMAAPVWRKGSFCDGLRVALKEIRSCLSLRKGDDDKEVSQLLGEVLRVMKVHYVPWHGLSSTEAGNRYAVNHNHWMIIDGAQPRPNHLKLPPGARERIHRMAELRVDQDIHSSWKMPKKLRDMVPYWSKVVLPTDWTVEKASIKYVKAKDKYVKATYEWVKENYRGDNWRHHLALVVSILFTVVLPFRELPQQCKNQSSEAETPAAATAILRNWPWVRIPKGEKHRRGTWAREPYMVMVSTLIISLMHPESPLSVELQRTGAFGEAWTKKHGQKFINAYLLIRLGVAVCIGQGGGMAITAKYQVNWALAPEQELRQLYDRLMNHLKNNPQYGVYFALRDAFGPSIADIAVEYGHTDKPAI